MQITTMKLSDLKKPEKNIRIHSAIQIKEFERSIKMFGQIRPIVIDENNVILAGNGLYDTLLSMGKKTAEVYKYENLTENQKKKLMIADNKIFSLGIENLETLNSFLEDLQDDLDIPGYDEEILKQMVSSAEEITEKITEYGTLDEEEIRSLRDSAARKEQRMQQAENTSAAMNQNEPQTETDNSNSEMPADEELTEVKRFVVCPKCGEKIWL